MTLLIILVAPAGRASTPTSVGSRWLVGAGMTLVSLSLVLFAQLDAGSTFWNILPGLLAGGLGMALTMTPTTAAAMGAVEVDKAGVGSAVLNSLPAGRRLARHRGHGSDRREPGRRDDARCLCARSSSSTATTSPSTWPRSSRSSGAAVAVLTVRKHRHASSPRRRPDDDPRRVWRQPIAGPPSSMPRSRSSPTAPTAARRLPRSRALPV